MNDGTCSNCGGRGALPCNRCAATGRMRCNKCEGTGHVIVGGLFSGPGIPGGPRLYKGGPRAPSNIPLGGSKPCRKCDTTGYVPCPKCNSSGWVMCLKCQGSGRYQHSRQHYAHEESQSYGTVKWYNSEKGFGFIQPDDGDADVHVSQKNLDGVTSLKPGDRVSYAKRSGTKGPWAAAVKKN